MKTEPDVCIYPISSTGDPTSRPPVSGLTKREWFTGLALEGLMSNSNLLADFLPAARKAAKVLHAERMKAGNDQELEDVVRESLDTLITFRAVEIGDMVIWRLNTSGENLEIDQDNSHS